MCNPGENRWQVDGSLPRTPRIRQGVTVPGLKLDVRARANAAMIAPGGAFQRLPGSRSRLSPSA